MTLPGFILGVLTSSALMPLPQVLSLEDAVAMARQQQPLARISQASADAAHARGDENRAPLLPQIIGSASYERTTANYTPHPGLVPPGLKISTTQDSSASYNYYAFQLTVNQLLYDFNYSIDKWRASLAQADAADANSRNVALAVDYNVRNAYFAAYAAFALVRVGQENYDNLRKHLDQIEGYVAAGTRAEIDLAQSKSDLATGKVQLITAQNNYLTAKVQLNQAMGIEAAVSYDVTAESLGPVANEDAQDDSLMDEALQNRQDVQQVLRQIRAAELTVSAMRGQYAPSLGLQANATDQGPSFNNLGWNWNAYGTLTWTFYGGGLAQGQVDEALANRRIVAAQLDMIRQQVRLDVEQARLGVRAAKETLQAAGEALFNARERLKYAEGRYQTGVGSIIELGDAQVAVTTAAAQQVQADYQLAAARAALLKAVARA